MQKGQTNSGSFKKGNVIGINSRYIKGNPSGNNKGHLFSKESKKKVSDALKQQYIDGTRTSFFKSNEPWNKGKKWNIEMIEKLRKYRLGTKLSEEHKQKISIANKGRIVSEETRRKIGLKHKGKIMSKEAIIKIKEKRALQILPKKDTKIEIKVRDFLDTLQIEYFQHKYINITHAYQCDFFIPSKNLVIECDGSYWHNYPTGRDIDHIRTSELIESGFKVLRLWEFEIKEMDLDKFIDKINT